MVSDLSIFKPYLGMIGQPDYTYTYFSKWVETTNQLSLLCSQGMATGTKGAGPAGSTNATPRHAPRVRPRLLPRRLRRGGCECSLGRRESKQPLVP